MQHWMYRVLDVDDDGDPLDWGVVTAADFRAAQEWVAKGLDALLEDSWPDLTVRFYRCTMAVGVWVSTSMTDVPRAELGLAVVE